MAAVWLLTAVGLLNTLEGLDRFTSKRHLKAAGEWIAEQSGGQYGRSKIYSNSRIVDYYAGVTEVRDGSHYSPKAVETLTRTPRWQQLSFLAVTLAGSGRPGFYRDFRHRIGKEPDMWFWNRKGSKVLVYDFRSEGERRP